MPPLPDRFETLRDCRALFLKHLGVLLWDCGQLSTAAIRTIQEGAGTHFDEMVESSRRGSFKDEAQGLTSSRITLVCEEDLELGITLDNLSARLFEESGGNLWKIQLRFVTLLNRPDLSKAGIPVGPRGICQGLDRMFAEAGAIGIDKKLQQLDGIVKTLQEGLPALYAEINAFLERTGVEAAQPIIVSSPEKPRQAPLEAPAAATNSLLALQQTLRSQLPGQPQGTLQGGGGGAAASLLSQSAIERLTFRLDELERHGTLTAQLPSDHSSSLETLIPSLFSPSEAKAPVGPQSLDSGTLGIPPGAPEGLAIDTMAKIFAAIVDDPALPSALKEVISSLQVTLLKLAIKDPDLFANTAHPARQLLDRMGIAVLGLPVDVPAEHPVCARLAEIARHLRSRQTLDSTVLGESVAKVDTLIAERKASITSTAQAYIPLLRQLDRRDQAIIQSRLVVGKLVERGVPDSIREFLDNIWSRVLQQVWLEHGPDSSQWQEHSAVIVNLLWTFQPKSKPEDRHVLARRLPEILNQLKSGMERVGVAAETQAAFLDNCFSLQTQSLRTSQPVPPASPEARPLETNTLRPGSGKPVAGEVESGQVVLRTLDFSGIRPAPARPLPCRAGDWLEIRAGDDETRVALLCHISPTSQRALFCNTDGKPALAIHPAILDKQLRDGEARILSSISLFDSAADRALRRTATL